MYSGHRDACYETMAYTRQAQYQPKSIYNNRQIIKTKQYIFWSSKLYENNSNHQHHDNHHRTKGVLPVYRSPSSFQKNRKDPSPVLSFCVPDVYSPGPNGKCSLPPPCSNLPPPPSEWLN
ncbi:unnamed protein product [Adineta ricciae]|uniref:Uncharacterized protein n=1 Tax=Adineta ricciae TaxID=249248 RepID=A0A815L5N3_ADIRI|nr:unnamed protein product [Adineta ricciae]CAF1405496.1 unnamed protein product [Adineta ricciae]